MEDARTGWGGGGRPRCARYGLSLTSTLGCLPSCTKAPTRPYGWPPSNWAPQRPSQPAPTTAFALLHPSLYLYVRRSTKSNTADIELRSSKAQTMHANDVFNDHLDN